MATADITTPSTTRPQATATRAQTPADTDLALAAVEFLASLRLTVVLFAAAILLIMFGTLAQVHYDVWYVVRESHFHVWLAWIEFRSIGRLVEMLFGGEWDNVPGGFYFPGGQIIGSLMILNLLAAHTIRFKANAKGRRLVGGLLVIALGIAAIAGVVVTSNSDTVKSELSPQFASGLWHSLRAMVGGLALYGVYWSIKSYAKVRLPEWLLCTGLVALVVAAAGWLFLNPEARLDDAGLRILWQLVKGTAAATILLAGCVLVFGKRAGMVVLHGGIGLLMIGEMLTGLWAEEAQMRIDEGQTVNYAVDIRTTELAFTDRSDPAAEQVTVVPQHLLANAKPGEVISNPELPVDLRVLRFDANSTLAPAIGVENSDIAANDNPATQGAGNRIVAKPIALASGIDGMQVNTPSTYVELLGKTDGESLGVYLASIAGGQGLGFLREQPVTVGKTTYDLELRFKRIYKDYAVKLYDFQFNRYAGTQVAKDFRSEVRLLDPSRNVDRDVAIWMNNPLRYGGDTLYQSSFDNATEQTTVLQVVSNSGWLIPYLSCQIVLVGMLAHFGITLGGFLRRRVEQAQRDQKKSPATEDAATRGTLNIDWTSPLLIVPIGVALLWGGYLASKARPAKDTPGEMRINEFGELPLTEGGRVKPYDTLARNTLQFLSTRQTVSLEPGADAAKAAGETKLPAIRWMLDVLTGKPESRDYPVFRIENLEVLDLLGLERRPGSFRYSYNEVTAGDNTTTIGKQLDLVREIDSKQRSVFQTKIAELGAKLSTYHGLANAFAPLPISTEQNRILEDILRATQRAVLSAQARPALAVAPADAGGAWLTQYEGQLNDLFRQFPTVRDRITQVFNSQGPFIRDSYAKLLERFEQAGETPTTKTLGAALDAYRAGNTNEFNTQVRTLKKQLAAYELELTDPDNAESIASLAAAERMSLAKASFESYFNRFSPFFLCWVSYIAAFGLCAASWLVWPRYLGRAATAIVIVTFVVHTFAIIGRIYISGRPPVTNLYSSAIFIGWAIVLAGLAFEAIFKMGIGTLLASVFGFLTLVTAHFMALDGDTFTVMQAVLDTQFWLATHVVCITFGYAATFVAGGVAAIYLIRSHMLGNLGEEGERTLPRMIYGTLCFAIFFSFVGTVLGGLWGDNSWGRFWGWDPKENGALIIVLWNALVLHARWGRMITTSGLAALAVFGNICTTWSWFGVNEMGVGLHAYGGLSEGVSLELAILRAVVFSHPFVIAIALVPREAWRNLFGSRSATEAA